MADYDYDQLFPGRFIKAGILQGRQVTVTIADVRLERLPDQKGTKKPGEQVPHKDKPILSFRGKEMTLVLNKTNAECLKAMFGRRTGAWLGKRITLAPKTVLAFGQKKAAIRIVGSPDIGADMKVVIDLGTRQERRTMVKTNPTAAPAAAESPEPPEEEVVDAEEEDVPAHDPATGEVSDDAGGGFS
jgi:hypothetical protein